MYEVLTKYIKYFSSENEFGEWKGGGQSDGTVQFPYVAFQRTIHEFFADFSSGGFSDKNYGETIEKRGWNRADAMCAAIDGMTAEEVCTCITYVIRTDRFSEGTFLSYVKKGIIAKLLGRLEQLDVGK